MNWKIQRLFVFVTVIILFWSSNEVSANNSGDAYVQYDSVNQTWTIGTNKVEKKLQINENGQFLIQSFLNKETLTDYAGEGQQHDEFSVHVGATEYTGATVGWIYDAYSTVILDQGELQLDITFHNNLIEVTRTYVIYPNTGVIQEWSTFKNISGNDLQISDPSLFRTNMFHDGVNDTDFYYMTGGSNYSGSNLLKEVPLSGNYDRVFDSRGNPEVTEVDGKNEMLWHYGQATGTYHEFFVLRNRLSEEGIIITFDTAAHWAMSITNDLPITSLQGFNRVNNMLFEDGTSIASAKSMTSVFTGDIDDMGNTLLDYIYKYKWDFTNEDYTAQSNIWVWKDAPLTENLFRGAQVGAYYGAGFAHVDDDWYDKKGDWNGKLGDDWGAINGFLNKYNIVFRLWMPPWHADPASQVLSDNPSWKTGAPQSLTGEEDLYYGEQLDLTKEEVVQWIKDMIVSKQEEFGSYQVRTDGNPGIITEDGVKDFIGSENWYKLLRDLRLAGVSLEGVSSGGELMTIESMRYFDNQQTTDGADGHYDGYWTTLLLPPAKHHVNQIGGRYITDTGTEWNMNSGVPSLSQLEAKRKTTEMGFYLKSQGLLGRGTKVYRPTVSGGHDETFMLQQMTEDNQKGYISITNNALATMLNEDVTIYPKGLNPTEQYTIDSDLGSMTRGTQSGSWWMENGIELSELSPWEVIFINLVDRPGQGTDIEAPTTPAGLTLTPATHFGHSGVELEWEAASDNTSSFHYEIYKNGYLYYKVSRSTFYFVEGATENDQFWMRTVDGDGNASGWAVPEGATYPPELHLNGPNLVINADFEFASTNEQLLPGWTTTGSDPDAALKGGGGGHTGDYSLTYYKGTAYQAYTYQTINNLEDGLYTLGAWIKNDYGQLGNAYMEIKDYGGSSRTHGIPTTSAWTQITIPNVKVTDGQATIGFFADSPGQAWFNVDNVEFYRQAGDKTPLYANLLTNNSFEFISDSTQQIIGWTTTGTDPDADFTGPGGSSGAYTLTHWKSSPYQVATSQTLPDLSAGIYTLSAWVWNGLQATDTAYLEVVCGEEINRINIPLTSGGIPIEISNITHEGGTCTIQIYTDAGPNSWSNVDNLAFNRSADLPGPVVVVPDKDELASGIANAQDVFATAVEGSLPGQYPSGSKVQLDAAIQAAVDVMDSAEANQQAIEQAVTDLQAAVAAFLAQQHQEQGNSGGGGGPVVAAPDVFMPQVDGTVKAVPATRLNADGSATAALTQADVNQATARAIPDQDGNKHLVVVLQKNGAAKTYVLELPIAGQSEQAQLMMQVVSPVGQLELSGEWFVEAAASGKNLHIILEDQTGSVSQEGIVGRSVLKVELQLDGKPLAWGDLTAAIQAAIPYKLGSDEQAARVRAYELGSGNDATLLKEATYDAVSGLLRLPITHNGVYAVGYSAPVTFNDLDSHPWARGAIEELAERGIVKGTSLAQGTFSPGSQVTRADFLMMLINALGLKADVTTTFVDVSPADYYYEAVSTAKQLGIVSGVDGLSFAPRTNISRQDMMVMITRALQATGMIEPSRDSAAIDGYRDADQIADYARSSIATMVEHGLALGFDGYMNPLGQASRAEAAVFLQRVLHLLAVK